MIDERTYRLGDGVEVRLYLDWVKNAHEKFAQAENLSWSDEVVTMYQRQSVIERRTVNYGISYSYSKTAKASIEWEPIALELKRQLDAAFRTDWQQCACNEYGTASSYISPHHDKDTIIDGEKREPIVIASISLGGQRTMVLTPPGANLKGVPITVSGLKKVPGSITIDLPSGSMILFSNSFNRYWKHSIPKDSKDLAGKRISLTYRHF
jgi:alkylated DNA repair dioxygenase AlkB